MDVTWKGVLEYAANTEPHSIKTGISMDLDHHPFYNTLFDTDYFNIYLYNDDNISQMLA